MPEKTRCEICGDELDPRGLEGHKRMKHGGSGSKRPVATDGGQEGMVSVEADDLTYEPEEVADEVAEAEVSEDIITFRTVSEIEVADEEMKEELLAELKKKIRGHGVQF